MDCLLRQGEWCLPVGSVRIAQEDPATQTESHAICWVTSENRIQCAGLAKVQWNLHYFSDYRDMWILSHKICCSEQVAKLNNGLDFLIYRPLARLWKCSQSGGLKNKTFYMRIDLNSWKRKFLLFCPPHWLHSHDVQGVYYLGMLVPVRTSFNPSCSDEGLETSVQNHFHGVKLIYINLKLIHYMLTLNRSLPKIYPIQWKPLDLVALRCKK